MKKIIKFVKIIPLIIISGCNTTVINKQELKKIIQMKHTGLTTDTKQHYQYTTETRYTAKKKEKIYG